MRNIQQLRSLVLGRLLEDESENMWYWDLKDELNYIIHESEIVPVKTCNLRNLTLIYPQERKAFVTVTNQIKNGEKDYVKRNFRMLVDVNADASIEDNYHLYTVFFVADQDDDGNVVGIIGFKVNIDSHRKVIEKFDDINSKYSSTINNMVNGLCYFDEDGRVIESNPAGVCILKNIFNKNVYQLNILDIENLQGEFVDSIRRREPITKVVRFDIQKYNDKDADIVDMNVDRTSIYEMGSRVGYNENVFYAEMHYMPIYDKDGTFISNLIISKDVTRQEMEFKKNELFRKQIKFINEYLGVSRVTYYLIARKYNIEFTKATNSIWVNVPIKEAYDKVHPMDRGIFQQMVDVADVGIQPTIEVRVRMKLSGYDDYRVVHFFFLKETDEKGRAVSYTGVLIDLTEKIKMQMDNQRVNELLINIINSLPADIFIKDIDDDFRYVTVNQRFATKYGYNTELYLGKNDEELASVMKERTDYDEEIDSLVVKWRNTDKAALEHTADTPLVLWEECKDKNGHVTYLKTDKFRSDICGRNLLICVSTNVTELQRARMKAEESDKMKTAFLMNVNHEIRTPLNAIVGFSDLLLTTDDDKSKSVCVEAIRKNNQLLLSIFNGVLDIAQLESGNVTLNKTEINMNCFVDNVCVRYCDLVNTNSNVVMNVEVPHQDCMVYQNSKWLYVAVSSLVDNALKFTEKGKVTIGYDVIDDGVKLWVKDTGRGVSPSDQKRIFDRFEKVDSFVPGIGLGLTICKTIAEEMDGKVGVTSEVGKGSTFWLWFPKR